MIKPTRGYVLVEAEEAEEKTASGFYVPDNAKEKPQKGVILAIGASSAKTENLNQSFDDGKVGDKVYYNRWAGSDIIENGKEYKIVKFEDVLAVIE